MLSRPDIENVTQRKFPALIFRIYLFVSWRL